MNFAIIGDSNFFRPLYLNVKQIKKIYPNSSIFIGDVGFTEDQRLRLLEYSKIIKLDFERTDKSAFLLIKPLFLLRLNLKCVYMDGDTILLKNFDEIQDNSKDIIVTIRENKRENSKINSGFFILNNPSLLLNWIFQTVVEIRDNPSSWNEQDALNKIIYNGKFNFKEVPCSLYNYTTIEKGVTNQKIIHLKKGRYKDKKIWEIITPLLSE
jgi:alpha-N-acetylglucosamine transferase